MSGTFRTVAGGLIDRSTVLGLTFDTRPYDAHPGDTLASALLAHGVHQVTTSVRLGRPRGIVSAGAEEPSALVQVEEPFPEPMLTATTLEVFDAMVARGLPGQGRLAGRPDPARYDAVHQHCELLVIGAGPAGLVAALTAARTGVRVVLVDEQSRLGGSLLGSDDVLDDEPALTWVDAVRDELATYPDVTVLTRTTAFGSYDDGFVLALQKRTDHLGFAAPTHVARQRVWRIRAAATVVATGAVERPIAFSGNDLPAVMLAGAARTYLHRYGVRCGTRAVLFTTNDEAYRSALDLARAGVDVAAVVEARADAPASPAAACAALGIPVLRRRLVSAAHGTARVEGVELDDGTRLDADLLLVSGGYNPAVHLMSHAGGTVRYDPALGAFVPGRTRAHMHAAGAARGVLDLAGALGDGAAAAGAALGRHEPMTLPRTAATGEALPSATVWVVPRVDGSPVDNRFVDLQRDATVSDILRAAGAGLTSVEHVKRYTTIGTAHDQGKTSGVLASGVLAEALGLDVAELGTTTYRPPYTPVSFAALAGRNRGALHDPVRTTPVHAWHVEAGAILEHVGQWMRPRYYPLTAPDGTTEDMDAAVLRECRSAREGVAMMDASTLGGIDVQGPDAGELLDRLYTNLMSSLKVGSVRYGVMCRPDGMVLDDGTVMRLDDERWLVSTTTGNAAVVLDWMEEWLQTEWPHLRVHLTSVTEQWVTVAVVGPRSRELLAGLTTDIDLANEAFGFMTWRDGTVAGLPARVARISFSGELAFEVNVQAWHGLALWRALQNAGDVTPYGTETMHVLRAEKGFPIVGQDTDGTITPNDLGMAWVVSKKKPDFVGKRSFARADSSRPDRKHLVGLLPVDGASLLAEGAQLVAAGAIPAPPVPMLGHVTSSYRSAALGRPFALALVTGGRERVGTRLQAVADGRVVEVDVVEPVLYDPQGARRDG